MAKATVAKPVAKTAPAVKPLSKTQLIQAIAESTKLPKKDVAAVIEALGDQIKAAFGKKGPGVFMLPGLIKIGKKDVPKRAAQKHVPNPFKPGEFRDIPAKPASCKPKLTALKALKELIKK